MKIKKVFSILSLALLLSITSCNNDSKKDINPYYENIIDNGNTLEPKEEIKKPKDFEVDIKDAFKITTEDGEYELTKSNGEDLYVLKSSGTYELTGFLNGGRIYMDDMNLDINLHLCGVKIISEYNSPIFLKSGKSLTVKAMEGTYNEIIDKRDAKTSDQDMQGEACIYAKSDLKVSGKGALYLFGNYNNGVATTDDLYIKSIILESIGRNNSIKGNDSITIESGEISAMAIDGDGLRTDNSDVSNKKNQHGSINILGGKLEIYANQDGIDSAYDVKIESLSEVSIYSMPYFKTKYAEVPKLPVFNYYYIKTKNNNYRYSIYAGDDSNREFYDAKFLFSSKNSRTGEMEYYYKVENTEALYMDLYVFEKDKENSLDDYYEYDPITSTITKNGDLIEVTYLDNGVDFNYSFYSFSNHNFDTKKKDEISKKGIKANNFIKITGGYINIHSYDDAIHANGNSIIESKSQNGLGDIVINGGLFNISSTLGDAIHADGILTINYGILTIKDSKEGLEGNIIDINGGTINVHAYDDGINASGDKYNPVLNITGGNTYIYSPFGDAIDSNGDYLQTGGVVNLYSNLDLSDQFGSCIDVTNKFDIKEGLIIAFGKITNTPISDINYVIFNEEINKGIYEIADLNITFKVDYNAESFMIISNKLIEGKSYWLKGDNDYIWTQGKGKTIYES